ncbi:MAG TPA: hypothetical protein DCQ06_09655, partial [Myxococcales bacterium]|nr:hypothetical protein [Myxococcales bacterium]
PASGTLVIKIDVAGLTAHLDCAGGTRKEALSKGDNKLTLPACEYSIAVKDKAGTLVGTYSAAVQGSAEAIVTVATLGRLRLSVADGSKLEVDGKKVAAKDDTAEAEVKGGKHSVVIKKPGFYGTKTTVDVLAGKTQVLSPTFEKFTAPHKTLAWAGIIGGSALVVAAVVIEGVFPADQLGGDLTRWLIMGAGVTSFVGGTMLMKKALSKENNPPVRDGSVPSQVVGANRGARLALRF